MGVLGRLPHTGDAVELATHRLTVTGLRRRRIVRVSVERTAHPASADA
jgi:CBS domain containing-hemolysin-like protein